MVAAEPCTVYYGNANENSFRFEKFFVLAEINVATRDFKRNIKRLRLGNVSKVENIRLIGLKTIYKSLFFYIVPADGWKHIDGEC